MLPIISSETTRKPLNKIPFWLRAVWVINITDCYFLRKNINKNLSNFIPTDQNQNQSKSPINEKLWQHSSIIPPS